MATLLRQSNSKIYIYHWFNSKEHFKTSTKIAVDVNDWDKSKQLPKSAKVMYKGVNVKTELLKHIQAMEGAVITLGSNISREDLKELYKSNLAGEPIAKPVDKRDSVSLLDCFSSYLADNELSENTIISYNSTAALCKKLKIDAPISEINHSFFKTFIHKCNNGDYSKNTIKVNLSRMKAVLNWSLKEGIHTNIEYKDFRYSFEESDSVVLTPEEVQKIVNLKAPVNLLYIKDYFIAAYYTALRLSDWDRININKVDKEGMFSLRSTKTGITSYVPVSPVLREILERWEREGQPKLTAPATIGRHLESLCTLAEIDTPVSKRITKGGKKVMSTLPKYKLVTTHTARRSMATNLILDGVSPYVCMSVTGHSTIESFSKYVKYTELQGRQLLMNLAFFK